MKTLMGILALLFGGFGILAVLAASSAMQEQVGMLSLVVAAVLLAGAAIVEALHEQRASMTLLRQAMEGRDER